MSTRALIGAVQENGKIKYRQVYSDGYPSCTGVYILEHWNNSVISARKLELQNLHDLNCSGILECDSEEEFLKASFFNDYHYLFKDEWYYGSWYYWDGKDINGKPIQEPEFYNIDNKGWRKLYDRFTVHPRIVRDYEEILDEEEN